MVGLSLPKIRGKNRALQCLTGVLNRKKHRINTKGKSHSSFQKIEYYLPIISSDLTKLSSAYHRDIQ